MSITILAELPQSVIAVHESDGGGGFSERFYVGLPPDASAVRGTIVLLHGLAEHSGMLFALARDLAAQGMRTIMFDLIGHGGHGAPLETFDWVMRAYAMGDDLELARRAIQEGRDRGGSARVTAIHHHHHDSLKQTVMLDHLAQVKSAMRFAQSMSDAHHPIFLGGFSLGGLLAAEACARLEKSLADRFGGVALICPALRVGGMPGRRIQQALMDMFWKWRSGPWRVLRDLIKAPMRLNVPLALKAARPWVTDVPEAEALFDADPLILKRLPSGYVAAIDDLMIITHDRGPYLPFDLLMLTSEDDKIVDSRGAIEFAEAAAAQGRHAPEDNGVLLVRYRNHWAHELMHSTKREEATTTLIQWLHERCG